MSQFFAYFIMGFEHISDISGYDHMLFIIVLCSVYTISAWRKVALLVTAFTLGHSTTLALAAFGIFSGNKYLIEILIPTTILATSLTNLLYKASPVPSSNLPSYGMALFFGFIHGMGFSNFFNALMGEGSEIILPLFSFNIGLEIGQLLIVVLFFLLYYFISKVWKVEHKSWILFFSGAGASASLIMILERI